MSKFDKIRDRMKKFSSKRRGGKGFVAKSPKKDIQTPKKDKEDKKNKDDKKDQDLQQKAKDQASLNVGVGSGGKQTSDFLEDLKDAYKTGLFTGGTKTKEFMDKYNLDDSDIVKLRTGIDQGLGTRMGGQGGNVLTDIVGDLRKEGILATSGPGQEFLQQRADEIFEPGMTPFDKQPIFEDPKGIFQKGANFAYQYNPMLKVFDLIGGGSSEGMRGKFYGREVLGLQGEELDNFAASVANDRSLYNQMMSTPEMQDYELNEFRAEATRQARANREGRGDPNPISGTQPNEDDDDDTTDPGTDPNFIPQQQNFFTFFDPNIGRYRSGTYDEYLKFVTAKDGGIIKLQQGGALPNAPGGVASEKVKKELDELFDARKEIQQLDTPTESEKMGSQMIMSDIDDKAKAISERAQEGIMSRLKDQSAREIFMASNPDIGPPLREDLKFLPRLKDSGISLLMEALRKSDISTGSANQFIEEALNNFVAAGIIPPNTSYDQLTDPFKELVTREAAMIARQETVTGRYDDETNQIIPNMSPTDMDRMRQEINMFRAPGGKGGFQLEGPVYNMIEGMPEKFEQINPVMRDRDVNIMNRTLNRSGDMYNVADGGIIGLKKGGMNDMMDADSLMFKDPSDEGEWEYNV